MPISAPIVTTPVPPIPATKISVGRSSSGNSGVGRLVTSGCDVLGAVSRFGWRRSPPKIVTKLGQKPFVQDISLLQVD